MTYVALLRGINVGGNNKVPMAELKACLEELGYGNVRTYIASGNVIFQSNEPSAKIAKNIEAALLEKFPDTTIPIKVVVLSRKQVAAIIADAPTGYGSHPDKFHSDVIFMMGKSSAEAMNDIELHPEVDKAWAGDGVIYFQRLSAKLTRSRVNKIVGKPIYKYMTLRTWNTVRKFHALMESDA